MSLNEGCLSHCIKGVANCPHPTACRVQADNYQFRPVPDEEWLQTLEQQIAWSERNKRGKTS